MSTKPWEEVAQRNSASLKNANRRLEFHAPIKPENGFQISQNNTNGKTHANPKPKQHSEIKPKPDKDVGIFDPAIVQKYSKWLKIVRMGPGLVNYGNTCKCNVVVDLFIGNLFMDHFTRFFKLHTSVSFLYSCV